MKQRMIDFQQHGLYDPFTERANCGVGAIANLNGVRSHDIVHRAIEILANLEHRGAAGCDPNTGDGAGLLIEMPHEFMTKATSDLNFTLPDVHEYGAGLVFLPTHKEERRKCEELVEQVVKAEGQQFLGWRNVPRNSDCIGPVAREVEPVIKQVFIGRGPGLADANAFERKLYVIRKVLENSVLQLGLSQSDYFYLPSLSSRNIIYKGLLLAPQIESYFPDLADKDMMSCLALVHQRYSTNTFPSWDLAQPFRFLCHNGEINTLRANINWLTAREGLFESPLFGDDIKKIMPVATPGASDSATLDNALELLHHTGRSFAHCVAMMIPEAWQNHKTMSDDKKAFYEYHSTLMEPWDGPASIFFCDGRQLGACLDRNGLRPSRYTVTKDGYVIMGSESGVLEVEPENVDYKGRLEPGRMFLIDTTEGRIIPDEEIKDGLSKQRPYRMWVNEQLTRLADLAEPSEVPGYDFDTLLQRQQAYGYTIEDQKFLLGPMAEKGVEPLGSMGTDTPLAVLSDGSPLLYNYFKQLFAQVTNPPLDAIREEVVTSNITNIGSEQDLFQETDIHCRQLRIEQPVLMNSDLAKIQSLDKPGLKAKTISITFDVNDGEQALSAAMDRICAEATAAVDDDYTILVLSDRGMSADKAGIPALLACAGVHHHLIREKKRTKCGIVVESGEVREIMHFALLCGYGCGAINPYLAFETLADMHVNNQIEGDLTLAQVEKNYIKAVNKGVTKVMSKMGISTLHSYRGAQIFEAVGLNQEVIDKYFSWTPSRIAGVGLDVIAEECHHRHRSGFPQRETEKLTDLELGGEYQWRRRGAYHLTNPLSIAKLQHAVRADDAKSWREYSELVDNQSKNLCTLRGLFEFKTLDKPIPLDQVEPASEIVKRFKTGAMSFGSISFEAHSNLAIAMNRIGGRSNTGEGGEDPIRYRPFDDPQQRRDALKGKSPWAAEVLRDDDSMRSSIKQVASGRFGVTSEYMVNSDELQIKMAQGAKPGEGGQLPGHKVDEWIGDTRNSTPGVGLISPPPHHDIYSIEDLSQLIHDLKNANIYARVCVKLVAEVGVGTVAAGVSKGKSDVVLISGFDGGTGASPQTSIKHAGLPWELGLAETHQVLVMNDLRGRIAVEADGQMKTGRDVAIACLLGAEEFGFATAPLIASGCIMMRKCHMNTCPVGIATQDPELRKKFAGKPEHVVRFMFNIAEDMRKIMASLGFRTVNEMIGQSDRLDVNKAIEHWKAKGLDFSKILYKPEVPDHIKTYKCEPQDHGIDKSLDMRVLLDLAKPALEKGEKVYEEVKIRNINRTAGTITGSELTRRWGGEGLPEDTLHFKFSGSAGQSFAAFCPKGMTMEVEGDANDYFCKGLSGAKAIIYPPKNATYVPEENILIGNVAFYGATNGEAYIRGLAGERFCVRNSGIRAVVEGIGDHGCEYMTGGRAVILGSTGRNFAAGMSGGVAYILDEAGDFGENRCNHEMVDLDPVADQVDIEALRDMIESHVKYTGSTVGQKILDSFETYLPKFIKVMPRDYKRVLAERAAMQDKSEPTVGVSSNG